MWMGTQERARLRLEVYTPQFSVASNGDGGAAWLRRLFSDAGFKDLVIHVDPAKLPAGWPPSPPLDWPHWPAWVEGTWGEPGHEILTEWRKGDGLELVLREKVAGGPPPATTTAPRPTIPGTAIPLPVPPPTTTPPASSSPPPATTTPPAATAKPSPWLWLGFGGAVLATVWLARQPR